tara:strand:+ start:55 stop:711 length:657 start_codon:yes stop_codon:yes gene_type:complete
MVNIEKIVDEDKIISPMMGRNQIIGVLDHLHQVLQKDIPGDIVELGCNVGTTSIFIRKLLDEYGSDKKFHVYDSWQGLPEKHEKDKNEVERQFSKGMCKTNKDTFIQNFKTRNLEVPEIHSGWFKAVSDDNYPEKICFAFYDGDFYTSTIDSLEKTFHKIERGGIIIIDDCGWNVLPGVERACVDFLEEKDEILELTGYPDADGKYGNDNGGGKILKL